MSVIVKYQPITDTVVLKGADSNTVRALEDTFGPLPIVLNHNQLRELIAMSNIPNGSDNPYQELVQAIDHYGSIRVVVEPQ